LKNYLITGGAGFIGSNLARRLIQDGNRVFIFDNLFTGFERNVPPEALFYKIDVSNVNAMNKVRVPHSIDVVYHLAAQSSGEASFEDPVRDIDYNLKATYNVLEFAVQNGAKRFVFSSSMSVYGEVKDENIKVKETSDCRPVSYYGNNKLASENLIRIFSNAADVNYTIFRLFNVYGPGQNMHNVKQGMVSIYLYYLIKNSPIPVKGSLSRFRDFIFIDDVIHAFIRSENKSETMNTIINLGTGFKTDVNQLLNILLKIFRKEPFDKWVTVSGNTQGDVKGLVGDIGMLKRCLNWTPEYDLERGLEEMKKWLIETKDQWVNN
jgi:UDP-glucose 4-epimerase